MSPMTLRKRKATADVATRPSKQPGHTKSRRATSHAKVTASSDNIESKETVRVGWHSLPRELRDIVYEYLWEDTPCIQPSPDRSAPGTFEVHYRTVDTSADSHISRLPQWLWVSRCFFHEGIEPMRRRGVWIFRWDLLDGLDATSSSVLGPSTATDLIIESTRYLEVWRPAPFLSYLGSRSRLNSNGKTLTWLQSKHPHYEHIAPELSSKLGPVLRSLTIDLNMWTIVHPDDLESQDVKWKFKLKALDRLEVRVERLTICGILCAHRGRKVIQTHLLTACREEVIRLGKILVGEDGFVDLEEVDAKPLEDDVDEFDVQVRFRKSIT